MNTVTDRQHLDNIRRTKALEHSIDMLRRAVSALGAASNGEPREMRKALIDSIHTRLSSAIAELRQLT